MKVYDVDADIDSIDLLFSPDYLETQTKWQKIFIRWHRKFIKVMAFIFSPFAKFKENFDGTLECRQYLELETIKKNRILTLKAAGIEAK